MGQPSCLMEKSVISKLPEIVKKEVLYPSVKDKVYGMAEREKISRKLISAFQMSFPKLEGVVYENGLTPTEVAISEFGAYLRTFPYHLTGEEILEAYRMASRGELKDFLGNTIELYPNLKTAQAGKILMAYQDFKCESQQHTLGIQKLKRLINPETERTPEEAKAEKRRNWEVLVQSVKENKPCDHAFLFYELILKKGGLKKFVSDPIAQKIVIKNKMREIIQIERKKTKSGMFNLYEIKHLLEYFSDPKEYLHRDVTHAFERLQAIATTLVKNELVYNYLKKQINKNESRTIKRKIMSHQEKQRIFDEYARSENYQKWEDLIQFNCNTITGRQSIISHIFAACDLVQAEQQKRIAENQRKIFYKFFEEGRPNMPICFIQANTAEQAYKKVYSIHGPQVEDWFYSAINDEEQLLMPENLIK